MIDADEILRLRAAGHTYSQIAQQTGVEERQAKRAVRDTVLAVRADLSDDVAEMFLLHHERLENLFRIVRERIENQPAFDDRPFKLAITILERQARLWALDRTGPAGNGKDKGTYDWLQNATPSDLIAEAERYGIKVPERFKLPAVLPS